jgi:hypothetical protein
MLLQEIFKVVSFRLEINTDETRRFTSTSFADRLAGEMAETL